MSKYTKFFVVQSVIIAILIVFAFIFCANAEEQMYVSVEFGSYLNAREWPDANAKLVGRFDRGELISIIGTDGDFSHALFANGNSSGWVRTEYLSTEKPYELEIGKYTITNTNARVAVRKKTSIKSKVVLWKYLNDEITVLSWTMQDDILWAKVKGGYIMGKYLELLVDKKE